VVEAGATTDVVVVALTVANTGDRLGDEMVQLYVRDDVASVARPDRQLVGFTRVALEPGESHDVRLSIHPSRLALRPRDAVRHRARHVDRDGRRRVGRQPISATFDLVGEPVVSEQRSVVATTIAVTSAARPQGASSVPG